MNYKKLEEVYTEAANGIKSEWFVEDTDAMWYDYVMKLPEYQRIVYLTMILDDQVLNGGFDQYFVNGYGQFVLETIQALKVIGALHKANYLETAFKLINSKQYNIQLFRKKLLNQKIRSLYTDDALSDNLEKLDDDYYADEEDLIFLLHQYLSDSDRDD